MGFTQEQKANVGNNYLTEIKRRIAVRSASKAKLGADDADKIDLAPRALGLVKRMLKDVTAVSVRNKQASIYRTGPNATIVDMDVTAGGKTIAVGLDCALFPELAAYQEAKAKRDKTKSELCAELEFLSLRAMNPGTASAFQQHAQRLMAVKPGESIKGANDLIDDFLASRRGFTCTL